jgi:hypothetical protein
VHSPKPYPYAFTKGNTTLSVVSTRRGFLPYAIFLRFFITVLLMSLSAARDANQEGGQGEEMKGSPRAADLTAIIKSRVTRILKT